MMIENMTKYALVLAVFCVFVGGASACDAAIPQNIKPPLDDLQKEDMPLTLEALVKEGGGQALATMDAIASKEGGNAIATVEAFATREGMKALATGQALASGKGEEMLATAVAYTAEQDFSTTVEAAAAGAKDLISGESPKDIPLVDVKTISALYKSKAMVTYMTSLEYETVVNFYKGKMATEGWNKVEKETTDNALAAVLVFEKEGRNASVTLTPKRIGTGTAVMIILSEK